MMADRQASQEKVGPSLTKLQNHSSFTLYLPDPRPQTPVILPYIEMPAVSLPTPFYTLSVQILSVSLTTTHSC